MPEIILRCSGSLFLSLIQLIALVQSLSMSLPAFSPLQWRTVMWVCVFRSLCNLSICSSVFSLKTSVFIQCRANLVQRERSQRQWIFMKIICSCAKKEKPEITPRKTPSWKQHCSLSPDREKQQRSAEGWVLRSEIPRDSAPGDLLWILHFTPKCSSQETRH